MQRKQALQTIHDVDDVTTFNLPLLQKKSNVPQTLQSIVLNFSPSFSNIWRENKTNMQEDTWQMIQFIRCTATENPPLPRFKQFKMAPCSDAKRDIPPSAFPCNLPSCNLVISLAVFRNKPSSQQQSSCVRGGGGPLIRPFSCFHNQMIH